MNKTVGLITLFTQGFNQVFKRKKRALTFDFKEESRNYYHQYNLPAQTNAKPASITI